MVNIFQKIIFFLIQNKIQHLRWLLRLSFNSRGVNIVFKITVDINLAMKVIVLNYECPLKNCQ